SFRRRWPDRRRRQAGRAAVVDLPFSEESRGERSLAGSGEGGDGRFEERDNNREATPPPGKGSKYSR
ncbi:hypothetical protein ABZV14_21305, partial [Streptosporangium canum]|uniref:hypothetical protein n=1 Tax=Streptosporangium canum TaxID=324952 RepID=UPI0033A2802E